MDGQKTSWMITFPLSMLAKPWQGVKRPGLPLSAPPAGYDVVRILLGLVLLTAAALKGYQLATEPTLEKGLLTSRWFLIGQVEFEIFLGVFLLSGLYKRLVWLVTLVCFVGFSCVTLYKGLSGEASCGCFGKVEISPWYTLVFDVLASGALVLWRPANVNSPDPAGQPVVRHWRRLSFPAAAIFLICLSAGYAMAGFEPTRVSDSGMIEGEGNLVVLEPEKWVGKPFPLMRYVDIQNKLSYGKWILLLHRHDCPDCHRAIRAVETVVKDSPYSPDAPGIALLEIPPYEEGSVSSLTNVSFCFGRVSDEKKWFIRTPVCLHLDDARVIQVAYTELKILSFMKGGPT